jgi:hypothetical protein
MVYFIKKIVCKKIYTFRVDGSTRVGEVERGIGQKGGWLQKNNSS